MSFKINSNWNTPYYLQLAEQIRERIQSGEFTPGTQLPVSRELQRDLKLSSFTVERAIRLLVEQGWLIRRPRIGTFVASRECPSETNTTTAPISGRTVRVIFDGISINGNYWFRLLLLLEESIRNAELRMEFRQTTAQDTVDELINGCDGILYCGYCNYEKVKQIKERKHPIVMLGSFNQQEGVIRGLDVVVNNDRQMAYLAIRHLLELGHRKIVCVIAPAGTQLCKNLQIGIRKAIAEAQLDSAPALIVLPVESAQQSANKIKKFLCIKRNYTAVFSSDPTITTGVVNGITQLGLRIPEEISVVNRGSDLTLQILRSITSVCAINHQAFANTAVDLLLEQLRHPGRPGRMVFQGEPQLLVRNSTRFLRYNDNAFCNTIITSENRS